MGTANNLEKNPKKKKTRTSQISTSQQKPLTNANFCSNAYLHYKIRVKKNFAEITRFSASLFLARPKSLLQFDFKNNPNMLTERTKTHPEEFRKRLEESYLPKTNTSEN